MMTNRPRHFLHLVYLLVMWLATNRQSHTLAFARSYKPLGVGKFGAKNRPQRQTGFWVALATPRGGGGADATSGSSTTASSSSSRSLLVAPALDLGKRYSVALETAPILTKSVTACCIFALSDYLAQKLENNKQSTTSRMDWRRTVASAAVGLFFFGPAAHAWYNMVFRVFPGTGLLSTLQKACMGQLFFGPSFTCIFFAAFLIQTGQFSLSNWLGKIRRDLPGAWLAGLGFWPLVDLVSYSLIPVQFIPLFVNVCSLVWTIYLSIVANRAARTD